MAFTTLIPIPFSLVVRVDDEVEVIDEQVSVGNSVGNANHFAIYTYLLSLYISRS